MKFLILTFAVAAVVAADNNNSTYSIHNNHTVQTSQTVPTSAVVSTSRIVVTPTGSVSTSRIVVTPTSAVVSTSHIVVTTHLAPTSHVTLISHIASTSHHAFSSINTSPAVTSHHAMSSSVHTTSHPTTTPSTAVKFNLTQNGTACIYFTGQVTLIATYNDTKNKSVRSHINLHEKGGVVSGKCFNRSVNANTTASITVTWTKYVTFTIGFSENVKTGAWYMGYLSAGIYKTALHAHPNKAVPDILHASAHFSTSDVKAKKDRSYKCLTDKMIVLPKHHPFFSVSVDFKSVQLQPFHSDKGFSKPEMCSATIPDKPKSSIVPIAVGCALAGLIVIVLIAYLIGRRRGNRGYQQV